MATKGPAPLPYTLVSGADFRNMEYPPVALSGGQVVLCNGPMHTYIGVLDTGVSKPHSGAHATVILPPAVMKGRVGGAVTFGDYVTVQSGWYMGANRGVYTGSVFSNAGSKDQICGIAFETVASGGIATLRLFETYTRITSA